MSRKKNIKIMVIVKKNLIDKIVVDNRTDFINQLNFILLEIQELDLQSKIPKKKIQIFNIYNN